MKKVAGAPTIQLKQQYAAKHDEFDKERANPSFKNGSRNVASLLSFDDDNEGLYIPNKQE